MNETLTIAFYPTPATSIPLAPRGPVAPQPAEIWSDRGGMTVPSRPIAWVQWLSRDAGNPNLVNFPFAVTVSLTLTIGLAAFGWGAILGSEWLAGGGFILALLGGLVYGLSHYED